MYPCDRVICCVGLVLRSFTRSCEHVLVRCCLNIGLFFIFGSKLTGGFRAKWIILSVPETVSHAIIPDFAQTGKGLLELKTINLCKSHYLDLPLDMRDTRGAACLRRAEKINGEYIRNARNADQKYNNTPPGFEGPIYKRLMQLNEPQGSLTKSLRWLVHSPQ